MCKKTFAFVHTVGKRRVEDLRTAVDNDGVVARIPGSCKQPRHNESSSFTDSPSMNFDSMEGGIGGIQCMHVQTQWD